MYRLRNDAYLQPVLKAACEHFVKGSEFTLIAKSTDGLVIMRSKTTGLTYVALEEALKDNFDSEVKTPESMKGGQWNETS
jgi:hypothetical protein